MVIVDALIRLLQHNMQRFPLNDTIKLDDCVFHAVFIRPRTP